MRTPDQRLTSYVTAFQGLAQAARGRLDAWFNPATGLGGRRDSSTTMQIGAYRTLTWPELEALYHGEDLPAIIVDRLPTDALSAGFELGSAAHDRAAAQWNLGDVVLEGRIWARLYGVGGVLIGTGSECGPMDAPLRLRDIRRGSLQYLMPFDREDISIAEIDPDQNSPTFGDARTYRIGSQNVHPSRLVLFPGARTGSRARLRNGGFDLSVLQRPYNVLRDTEQTWRSVMALLSDLSQGVMAINNLGAMISNGQKDVVMDRMEIVSHARSVARMLVLDAENESFTHVGAQNITGVDPLLVRVFQRLAAAADMPLTLLMGTSPAGLNATGESDLAIWYKKCAGERRLLEPGLHFLAAVVSRDAGLDSPEAIVWPKLWELSDLEQADLESKQATTAKTRIDGQITDPDEERRVLAGETLADVIKDAGTPDEIDEDDDTFVIEVGSIWVDSRDGTRIEVQNVKEGRVYFTPEGGGAQRSWLRRNFLSMCMRAPSLLEAEAAASEAL